MWLINKLFSFSIGSIFALLIGIISTPIITRLLSPSEYGVATIFITVATLISTVSYGGFDQAFMRFFYEGEAKKLLLKCLGSSIIIATCISVILLFFSKEISGYISSDDSFGFLLILYVFTMIFYRYATVLLRMLQFGYRYSIIQTLYKILELAFTLLIAIFVSLDRYALIYSTILTMLVLTILCIFFSKSFLKQQKSNIENEINIREIMNFSIPLVFSSFFIISFQMIDKLLLNIWVSEKEVGIYSAGLKLIGVLNIFQTSFTLFWTSVSLEHFNKKPDDKTLFEKVSRIVTIVMILVAIIVVVLKDWLILFLGPEYREASKIIGILVLVPVAYTMSETTVQGVNFLRKTYIHIIISSITLLISLLLCIVLIPHFGIEGAAVSMGISYVFFYFIRTYFGMKCYKFDIKLKETTLLLFLLVSWMLIIMIYNNIIFSLIGGLFILFLLIILYINEFKYLWLVITRKMFYKKAV